MAVLMVVVRERCKSSRIRGEKLNVRRELQKRESHWMGADIQRSTVSRMTRRRS